MCYLNTLHVHGSDRSVCYVGGVGEAIDPLTGQCGSRVCERQLVRTPPWDAAGSSARLCLSRKPFRGPPPRAVFRRSSRSAPGPRQPSPGTGLHVTEWPGAVSPGTWSLSGSVRSAPPDARVPARPGFGAGCRPAVRHRGLATLPGVWARAVCQPCTRPCREEGLRAHNEVLGGGLTLQQGKNGSPWAGARHADTC